MNSRLTLSHNKVQEEKKAFKLDERVSTFKWLSVVAAVLMALVVVGLSIVAAIYVPEIAVYVPIFALGLALALQKYTASFAAYFVITFTKIYDLGDRIRIGNIKGDVRSIGMLHTTLEEVGEDEKLGGELTGRLLHVPNLVILDQPVLNYSKDYSESYKAIPSDYMFDEVRIPLTLNSNPEKAAELLEGILKDQDEVYIKEAEQTFQNGYPRFLHEALRGPRVLVHIEPQHIWIKGKFVTPLRGRNELRSQILLRFLREISSTSNIKLA